MLFLTLALLAIFYVIDHRLMSEKGETDLPDPTPSVDVTGTQSRLGFDGKLNFALLAVVVALVLISGVWRTPAGFEIAGTHVGVPGLVRDVGLLVVALLSIRLTPARVHQANEFGWGPMQEVAAVCRHLPDHHSRDRHAQGRCRRSLRRCGARGHQQ